MSTVTKGISASSGRNPGTVQRGLDAPLAESDLARIARQRQRAKALGLPLNATIAEIEFWERKHRDLVPLPRRLPLVNNPPEKDDTHTRQEVMPSEPEQHCNAGIPVARPDRPLAIRFPWAVVVPDNRKNTVSDDGRIFLSKRYRTAKAAAHSIALGACKGQRFASERVTVSVYVCPPDDRRRDIANVLKMLLDALKGAAYDDDDQIDEVHVFREVPTPDGFVSVIVDALP